MSSPESILSKTRLYKSMRGDLSKMQRAAAKEIDPKRKAKLEKNIGIRTAFLEKLRDQTNVNSPATTSPAGSKRTGAKSGPVSKTWDWETIETIPGEADIEWFDQRRHRQAGSACHNVKG